MELKQLLFVLLFLAMKLFEGIFYFLLTSEFVPFVQCGLTLQRVGSSGPTPPIA